MTHTATCGHAITGEGILLTLAGHTRQGFRCTKHVTFCWRCALKAYRGNHVLQTDDAIEAWYQRGIGEPWD